MNKRIYLDHNAASMVDPRVIESIENYLRTYVGNPSSAHSYGRECRAILTKSRDTIAAYLGVRSDEILFTSGATEGANLVIRGLFCRKPIGHIITSGLEHSCVYNTIKELESLGCVVTYLETGEWGAVRPEAIQKALRPDTKLIAIMGANNETGVKTDVGGIASIAYTARIPFFVDAVALIGKETFCIPEGVSAMCFSGQKIHATQGTGFCFVRRNLKILPLVTGGDQQFGKRAGTENLPGIVGMCKAVSLLQDSLQHDSDRIGKLRDYFEKSLQNTLGNLQINGSGPRVGNTSNLYFPKIDGETLLSSLDMEGIAASHGSACESGAIEPSRILLNMGYPRDRVNSSLRFSFSRFTTQEEIETAIQIISKVVKRIRSFSSKSS
jgi:cysteine desulfurase